MQSRTNSRYEILSRLIIEVCCPMTDMNNSKLTTKQSENEEFNQCIYKKYSVNELLYYYNIPTFV